MEVRILNTFWAKFSSGVSQCDSINLKQLEIWTLVPYILARVWVVEILEDTYYLSCFLQVI